MEAYDYWLIKRWNIRSKTKLKLLTYAGSSEAIYNMKKQHLYAVGWLTAREKEILEKAQQEEPVREYELFQKRGGHCTSIGQPDYPKRLLPLSDCPFGLFYYGRLPEETGPSAAVVGARSCSFYGRAAAVSFGEAFAGAGITVISGMACGIDSAAQLAALDAGGRSCAVLGCGIDICYPASSSELYWRLRKEGCVLSEYPPGMSPMARNFPARNRIISGLADKVLVIEAREKSGSLITADFALDHGRDVFAVPGRISDALSRGCNQLIRQGAGIAADPESLISDMGFFSLGNLNKYKKNENSLAKEEKLLYSCVDLRPRSLDEILEKSGFTDQRTIELLLNLQLKGYITEISRNTYVRTGLE